ncbi:MAG: TolB-like protein [Oceanospirillaceae bacterium]|jgi:TolB-like protein
MLKITKLMGIALLSAALSACSTLQLLKDMNPLSAMNSQSDQRPITTNSTKLCADDDGIFSSCEDMLVENKISESLPSLPSTELHFNMLGEYTEQMAADLQNDVRGIQVNELIVVASFVHLNSSLQTTDTLGNQLAEYFINDLQKIGLPVADHKLMGVLDVNDKGDFAFSRDMGQFYNNVNIGYVLTGTMLKNSRGLVVNARIINFKTNAVVASSSKFLPNIVVNGLM